MLIHQKNTLRLSVFLIPGLFQQAAFANDWLDCVAISSSATRLECFDQKARQFASPTATPLPSPASSVASSTASLAATANTNLGTPANTPADVTPLSAQVNTQRATVQPSEITRFWDLEGATARDTFELRAYRPISLSVASADKVNKAPMSPSIGHTAPSNDYSQNETKINLSVRTKIASGLLRQGDDPLRDSLWFGYSQQSYWQLFNSVLSRPFRSTDHEPELIYIFPHFASLPLGWTYRLSGVGLVHQSNGQSLPLSRSWNRLYVMGTADKIAGNGDRFTLQARLWQRVPEKADKDDNPDINDYIGRGELAGRWTFDSGGGSEKTVHTLGLVVRHALRQNGRGSARIDYLRSIGKPDSGLRFHTQIFTGYGDSLIDYNRRRTVLSVGMSLVDW